MLINIESTFLSTYITYRTPGDLKHCQDYFINLEEEIAKYSALGSVCITGDINARTAMKLDYLESDDITDMISGFTEYKPCQIRRYNMDMKLNAAGLQLLNLCKVTDILIVNGRIIGNLSGHYTYCSNNGSSVVDYTLADSYVFKKILYHTIELPSHLSDHSLQKFSIRCNYDLKSDSNMTKLDPLPKKFKWTGNASELYPMALLSKELTNKLSNFHFQGSQRMKMALMKQLTLKNT